MEILDKQPYHTFLFPFLLLADLSCCEIIILCLHARFIQFSIFALLKNTAEERFSKEFSRSC